MAAAAGGTVMRAGQRGVALLVALLVVALAAILIAGLLGSGELAFARTRNSLRATQASAYARGMELYASQVLLDTWDEGPDTRNSAWAIPLLPQSVPGGSIQARMEDLGGCFNLNNLAPSVRMRAEWRAVFRALLAVEGLDPQLEEPVADWLDPQARADAGYYLARALPYRPRRGLFAHASELRLVRGFDGRAWARLAPVVCALAPDSRLNVNTANVLVLRALGLAPAEAQRLWQDGAAAFRDVDEFLRAAQAPALAARRDLLTTRSDWFLLRGEALLDGVPFAFHSVIARLPGAGVRVVARSRGGDVAVPMPLAGDDAGP